MYDNFNAGFSPAAFDQPIAEQIWRSKYQFKSNGTDIDHSVSDTWLRVSNALALAEAPNDRSVTTSKFYRAMEDFKLLPAGRILSGAGTKRDVTLSNTFVMKTLPDSVEGIMDVIKEAALTMKMGGGLGFDFSTIRPKGALVRGLDCPAAGPLAAMDICDSVCRMLVTGMGRGAMMGVMRVDHPDIEEFVQVKSDRTRLRNFNLSVLIPDAFMEAVARDDIWHLKWNDKVQKSLNARDLWNTIMEQNFKAAEPGVLFIDRINAKNSLGYLETIAATNSCAEQPLPPNGTCPLSSINLAKLVTSPFGQDAYFQKDELKDLVATTVRLLDNSLDVSRFAVEDQRIEAQTKRRIGIGVTGVADALILLGVPYGSDEAVELVGEWMRIIQNAAYLASAKLAAERGPFDAYRAEEHLQNPMIAKLDPDVRAAIEAYGLRNGALTTIAPTGTTSMYGGNVSSGIEPVFSTSYTRKITNQDGTKSEQVIEDYAVRLFRQMFGNTMPLPKSFVTVFDLSPSDHLRIQSAAQEWIDSGISKTVNCPADITFAEFKGIYREAYDTGCKGCTTYRPNDVTGSVLSV
jgi:ribonucleoside-diphosphate reductase alpha chain